VSTEVLYGLTVIEKARHDGSDWENAYCAISFECTTTRRTRTFPANAHWNTLFGSSAWQGAITQANRKRVRRVATGPRFMAGRCVRGRRETNDPPWRVGLRDETAPGPVSLRLAL
jgi:hypothetical protein